MCLRCVGTLSGEATLPLSFLPSLLEGGYSKMKEFAPQGANPFVFECTPFQKGFPSWKQTESHFSYFPL